MENEKPETPETIISSFAVIPDKKMVPFGVFLFHVNDEYNESGGGDDDVAQPAGWKLPGGRYEKPRDKTPRHTARNETSLEIGLAIRLKKFFRNSRLPHFGEALRETKVVVGRGKIYHLCVRTFLMERIGKRTKNAEPYEGGARGSFSLTDILLMPLARDTEGGQKNPYGIHFSARKRIFITLKRAGYDFRELIPDLPWLLDEINRDEVGEEIYYMLKDALDAPATEPAPDYPEDVTEIAELETEDDEYTAEWRRWAEKYREFFVSVAEGKTKISPAK